jgi:hypothetical protein
MKKSSLLSIELCCRSSLVLASSLLLTLFAIFAAANEAAAQKAGTTANSSNRSSAEKNSTMPANTGTITGQVFKSNGQPFADVTIFVHSVGSSNITNQTISTNSSGRFRATKLPPGAYTITAYAPGYFAAPDLSGAGDGPIYYKLGDTTSITLIKGGVITGKVFDSSGRPVVGARVRAITARTDNSISDQPFDSQRLRERLTDDRGVYRIYGIEPGSYIVSAVGFANHYRSSITAPTYFPSASRSRAAEVIVSAGEETGGIDIRYRSEQGHTISGTLTGAIDSAGGDISVILIHATSGTVEAKNLLRSDASRAFTFQSVFDGEYDLIARRGAGTGDSAVSVIRRVTVKGSDLTGVELSLAQLGSISGRVVIETTKGMEGKAYCEAKRPSLVEEIIITASHSDKKLFNNGVPNDKGEFTIRSLETGNYYLKHRLPSENWYIQSINLAKTQASDSIQVKSGERATGLIITLGEDAAGLRGKVAPAEGEKLPSRLRVYLVPTDREHADNVLRYMEATVRGSIFELSNIAPGRYWIIARKAEDDNSIVSTKEGRATLRREAEAANTVVELTSCLRATDYLLKYK